MIEHKMTVGDLMLTKRLFTTLLKKLMFLNDYQLNDFTFMTVGNMNVDKMTRQIAK
jgi:hypothetical protein